MSDGCNLNYETWSDLVRSRSRANTNADPLRGRSATDTSNGSGGNISTFFKESILSTSVFRIEFAAIRSPLATSAPQEGFTPISVVPSININSSTYTPFNICMMCKNINNGTAHEDANISTDKNFNDIKSLASRLTVGIHTEEIEKKLLR